jgi:carbon monoxide dehydrogenase subunit G
VLKRIAAAVFLLVALLTLVIALRPAEFHISRTRTLAAPPAVVHGHVNDLGRWPAWSPWEKKDPAMKRELSAVTVGPGATYAWAGDSNVGEGRMTITESRAPDHVVLQLEFLKPMAAINTVRFDLAPSGAGTRVTWTMTGYQGFVAKAFTLFMDMDRMVGSDFEQGLAGLDAVTAAAPVR